MNLFSTKIPVAALLTTLVGFAGNAYAAFTVDLTAPALSSTFYKQPTSTLEHEVIAQYSKDGLPPNDMVVPTLAGGSTLRLKLLLPPGVKQAFIRGESNDWIGVPGQQPVVGVVVGEITGTCPSTTDNLAFTCDGVVLASPAGGLSMPLYIGEALAQPKYVSLVLHNPGNKTFSFGSLSISMLVGSVSAYKTWLNDRPWTGTGGTGSLDGVGDTTSVAVPTSPQCDLTEANLLSTLDFVSVNGVPLLEVTSPRVKYTGLPDMRIKLQQISDPKDPSRFLFKFADIQWLTCGQRIAN